MKMELYQKNALISLLCSIALLITGLIVMIRDKNETLLILFVVLGVIFLAIGTYFIGRQDEGYYLSNC